MRRRRRRRSRGAGAGAGAEKKSVKCKGQHHRTRDFGCASNQFRKGTRSAARRALALARSPTPPCRHNHPQSPRSLSQPFPYFFLSFFLDFFYMRCGRANVRMRESLWRGIRMANATPPLSACMDAVIVMIYCFAYQ